MGGGARRGILHSEGRQTCQKMESTRADGISPVLSSKGEKAKEKTKEPASGPHPPPAGPTHPPAGFTTCLVM